MAGIFVRVTHRCDNCGGKPDADKPIEYVRRVTVNYLRGTTRKAELVAALSGPAATKARLVALARHARTTFGARQN